MTDETRWIALDDDDLTVDRARGPALLAFAGPPTREVLETMVACADNLGRVLLATSVGSRAGGVIASDDDAAQVAAMVRRTSALVVVVAGATSSRIVRCLAAASRRPVLIARSRQPWQRVLTATDLLTRGLPVVTAGAVLAASRGAASVVLHNVAPAWSPPALAVTPGAAGAFAAAGRLRRLARIAGRSTPASTVVVSGASVADRAIVEAAVRQDADLLVVGMRRPARRLRARCADRVVAASPGNVLVVPLGAARRRARLAVQP